MEKSELLRALQTEIRRHDFSTFVDNPPAMAQGGTGVVTPGCPACRKRLFTMANFTDHLADDVLPRSSVAVYRVSETYVIGARNLCLRI